jgi:hypothetical protein
MSTHPVETPRDTASASQLPGIGLWVLVSGALLYGVVKTIETAATLFGG